MSGSFSYPGHLALTLYLPDRVPSSHIVRSSVTLDVSPSTMVGTVLSSIIFAILLCISFFMEERAGGFHIAGSLPPGAAARPGAAPPGAVLLGVALLGAALLGELLDDFKTPCCSAAPIASFRRVIGGPILSVDGRAAGAFPAFAVFFLPREACALTVNGFDAAAGAFPAFAVFFLPREACALTVNGFDAAAGAFPAFAVFFLSREACALTVNGFDAATGDDFPALVAFFLSCEACALTVNGFDAALVDVGPPFFFAPPLFALLVLLPFFGLGISIYFHHKIHGELPN